jgi:hypothetical protein
MLYNIHGVLVLQKYIPLCYGLFGRQVQQVMVSIKNLICLSFCPSDDDVLLGFDTV